jgi:hypothetical protein
MILFDASITLFDQALTIQPVPERIVFIICQTDFFASRHTFPDENLFVDFRRKRIHILWCKHFGRIFPQMASAF